MGQLQTAPIYGLTPFRALKLYGPKAKLAVPAMVELLGREQDPGVRSLITNALEAIDPEAAAKAGIAPPVAGQTH